MNSRQTILLAIFSLVSMSVALPVVEEVEVQEDFGPFKNTIKKAVDAIMPFKKSVEKAAKEIVEAKEAELDGTATQSSEGWSGRPSRAIDGNTNQNYGKASCSHTAIGDKDPWWKLDLGSPKLVTKVQVWNRVGCCSNRLSGVKISVDGAVCGALSRATSVQTVACNKKGQDVKFSMPRSNDYLTLCEVKVWGVPTPKPIKVIEEKIEKEEVAEVAEVVAEVVPVVEATLPPKAIEKIVPKVMNCRKVLMDCIRKARSAIKCFRSQPCQCQRSKALKKKCEEKEKAVEVEDPKETGAKIPETRPPCPMMKCMFLPKPGCKLVQSGEKDAAGCLKHPCGQQKCEPTAEPTEAPTTQPTTDPTEEPSADPTEVPAKTTELSTTSTGAQQMLGESTISSTNLDFSHHSAYNVMNTGDFTLQVTVTPTNDAYPRSYCPFYFGINPTSSGHTGLSIGHGQDKTYLQVRMADGSSLVSQNFQYGYSLSTNNMYQFDLKCTKASNQRQCRVYVNGVESSSGQLTFNVANNIYASNGGRFGNVWGWRFIGTMHRASLASGITEGSHYAGQETAILGTSTISSTNVDFQHNNAYNVMNTGDWTLTATVTPTNDAYPRSYCPFYFGINPTASSHKGLSIGHGQDKTYLQVRMADGSNLHSFNFQYASSLSVNNQYRFELKCKKDSSGRKCRVYVNGVESTSGEQTFGVSNNIYDANGGRFGNVWGWRFIGTLTGVTFNEDGEATASPTNVPTTTTDEPSFAPTSTPTHKPTAVPTGTPTELPTALPTRAPIQPAGCPAAGAGWKLVRHVPAGNSWHPARDQLTGTSVYGSPANSGNAWSVKFSSTPFNEFLFATGDCKKWLIAKKDQVLGWYSNGQRQILKSSTHSSPYTAAWYRRQGALEDPWISLNDHHPAIGQGNILYGENNFGSTHASAILPRHGGANVYIR